MTHLITLNQAKMLKSKNLGYLSAVLNLSPAFQYKGNNTCPNAGQCKAYCLKFTGRNGMQMAIDARERRTKLFYDERSIFLSMLKADLYSLQLKARKEDLLPTFRFNGLSDIEIEDIFPEIFEEFKAIQFIDYTKIPDRMFKTLPDNYHLTYSVNEKTQAGLVKRIYDQTRFNCAVVFQSLPDKYTMDNQEYSVFNGDESDLRQLDPRGQVIGLRFKNPMHNKVIKGKKLKSGFLILA
jgi:hypothetical protein